MMARHDRELSGEHYPTYEQVVTEVGEEVQREELRGRISRLENRGDASGYVMDHAEMTGQPATLRHPQRA